MKLHGLIARAAMGFALLAQCLAVTPGYASQASTCMPTTGTVSGLTFAQDVNAALAALISANSGASAPANDCSAAAVKGQVWLDTSTTPNILKQYDGSSWLVLGYFDAVSHIWTPPVGGGTASLSSAATVDLGSVPQAYVSVTGNTGPITSFGSSAVTGTIKVVTFASTPTVTYNGTSMILPSGATDLTAAAGDVWLAVHLGSGNWRVLNVQLASGRAVVPDAVTGGYRNLSIVAGTTPNNQMTITADALTVETAAGVTKRLSSVSIVDMDITASGANGLDTSTVGNNTPYAIWVIYNPSTNITAGLFSASFTAPTMPSGYTYKTRVARNRTDGSAHLYRMRQKGNLASYIQTSASNTTAATLTIASGNTGGIASPISVVDAGAGSASFFPTTAGSVLVTLDCGMSTNETVKIGSSATNPGLMGFVTSTSTAHIYQTSEIQLESTSVEYTSVISGACLAIAYGYRDNL